MEPNKETVTATVETPVEKTPLEKLNDKRKAYCKADLIYKASCTASVLLCIGYIVLLFTGFLKGENIPRIIIGVVLLVIVLACLYILPLILKRSSKYKTYSLEYKTAFLKPVFEGEFPNAVYKEADKISIKEISECSMLKKSRSATANDCIEGRYKGVDFLRYDVELSAGKKSSKSDCVVITCGNKTIIKGELQIVDAKFTVGRTAYEKPEDLFPYITGEESFDKHYKMYVESREEADKVLSKDFQKSLCKFSAGGPIAVFFDKQRVYLVIRRRKDSLEAPVYKAVKESTCRKEAGKEAQVIRDWLELLDQNALK